MKKTHAILSEIFEHGIKVRLDCTLGVVKGWTVTVHQGFNDPRIVIKTNDPSKASAAYAATIKEMNL